MRKVKYPLFMLFSAGFIMLLFLIMQPVAVYQFKDYIAMLFPKGQIALEERNLLFLIQIVMLLVVLPVYVLTFVFTWRYSAENKKSRYEPELTDNLFAEFIWWGLPLVLTIFIAIVTWQKTHELDPFKPIDNGKKPITIQVVALQWKWLFIYPEEKIATLNFLQIPENIPVRFEISADAPMNSFWIPHLGGQIYAMPAMKTELNLIANETGDFRGSSANLSGLGFAGMHFICRASTAEEYKKWIEETKNSKQILDRKSYEELALPSQNNPVALYQLKDNDLFEFILNKYMHPHHQHM